MTGPEGFHPEEPPKDDETTRYIGEVAKSMGGAGLDASINWRVPHPDVLDTLAYGKSIPELQKYLSEAGRDPRHILTLPDIPQLIGGSKSSSFIIKEAGRSPDAPPIANNTISPDDALYVQNYEEFAAFFDAIEGQADRQYDEALFAAQQLLAEAGSRSADIQTIFVPGTVDMSADDYFERLQRLAQDLGVDVVTHVEDTTDEERYSQFLSFSPPRAASVEEYWRRREQARDEPEPDSIAHPPSEEALLTALARVQPYSKENARKLGRALTILASAAPETLRSLLDSPDQDVQQKLALMRQLAYGNAGSMFYVQSRARVILAKQGDAAGVYRLLMEAGTSPWNWDIERLIVPLGVYAKLDSGVRMAITAQTQQIMSSKSGSPDLSKLRTLLGALYHSFSPEVAAFLAYTIRTAPDMKAECREAVYDSAGEWFLKYADIVLAADDSPQRTQALHTIEQTAVELLDGGIDPLGGDKLPAVCAVAGHALHKMNIPGHEERLRKHMLWLFEYMGSRITQSYFEAQYLEYRRKYGDIPEISRRITLKDEG